MRASVGAAVLLLSSTTADVARAADAALAECYDAHEAGQLQRKKGSILAARQSFATCGRSMCPSIVQKDCVVWAQELAAQQPTVVIAVVRSDGTDVLGARVFIDGASTPADGHGVELDPGKHTVRVERGGAPSFDRSFTVREGDRARRVAIVLPSDPAPRRSSPPLLTYVFGGVTVASLASFGTFAAIGKSRENELADSCGDRCGASEVDSVRRSYLVADVSLGVAVVSATAAVIAWLVAAPPVTSRRTASGAHGGH